MRTLRCSHGQAKFRTPFRNRCAECKPTCPQALALPSRIAASMRILFPRLSRSALTLCLLPCLLLGCASIVPGAGTTASIGANATRVYHQTIELGGRLSVRYQQNGKEEAVHGNFTWTQTPDRTLATLLSPLGQTMAKIEIMPDRSILMQPGQPVRSAADVDALTAETLGWPLPISGLREWLQGFATGTDGLRFAASPINGKADTVSSEGWKLHYVSWQDDAQTPADNHPRRIDLERSTAQAGEVALRIVIDSWQPHSYLP